MSASSHAGNRKSKKKISCEKYPGFLLFPFSTFRTDPKERLPKRTGTPENVFAFTSDAPWLFKELGLFMETSLLALIQSSLVQFLPSSSGLLFNPPCPQS